MFKSKKIALKPCRYCGKESVLYSARTFFRGYARVECPQGCASEEYFAFTRKGAKRVREQVIEVWNGRNDNGNKF